MGILFLKMIGYPHPYLGSEERYAMGKRQAKDRITLGDPRWNWRTTNLRPSSLGSFVMRMLERDEENRHTVSC
jgi:hypothetical protein